MNIDAYLAFAHRVQTAIAILMSKDSDLTRCQPKHLRTGIDTSKADFSGLASLLIEKNVITEDEYIDAITVAMRQEADRYEEEVQQALGNSNIRTG